MIVLAESSADRRPLLPPVSGSEKVYSDANFTTEDLYCVSQRYDFSPIGLLLTIISSAISKLVFCSKKGLSFEAILHVIIVLHG